MLNSELITFLAIGSVIFLIVFSGVTAVASSFFSSTLGRSCFFSIGFPLRRGANIKNFFF